MHHYSEIFPGLQAKLISGMWEWRSAFLVILLLHSVAILFFTKGFLLTRTELSNFSRCSDVSQSPCFSNLNQSNGCWTKPAVDRLVIIVLDALRFDFVAPSSHFEERKPWMDKLHVLQKLSSQESVRAKMFKAIADPPTTSLQRLKGVTTGGLPTFIDVGNSFGAPAIVEDNLIYQLAQNGKRVVMMGDDTWLQLFPRHFKKSYPFPSFNVKDLHTVDNGCIQHLFPSLFEEDWDVLIAHFLGLDHAGHILGVDSIPMMEKLEQYNFILEKVIETIRIQSGPGGLHENTLLIVMGDHGQTLNGDHGGGTSEEVETSIFAMTFKKPPSSVQVELDTSRSPLHLGKNMRVSSIQQLDFAVTVSALLGIPFPFGSIGHVNPELYDLVSGASDHNVNGENFQNSTDEWINSYVNVLCINAWQVKRYIDVYSASSVIGFSFEDLTRIADMYAQAEQNWSHIREDILSYKNDSCYASSSVVDKQIEAYSNFLGSIVKLARSKWTEFNLKMMGAGLVIMFISFFFHLLAMTKVSKPCELSSSCRMSNGVSLEVMFSCSVVIIHAFSLLSNSYILEEGKVANFLLAASCILTLRYSIMRKKMLLEAIVFLLLIFFLRVTIEVGLSKQASTSQFMKMHSSWILKIVKIQTSWICMAEVIPFMAILVLLYLLCRWSVRSSVSGIYRYVIMGTVVSYMLILALWVLENNILNSSMVLNAIGKNSIPRTIYSIALGQLLLLALGHLFNEETLHFLKSITVKSVAVLAVWSSPIIILLGKQGSLIALAAIIGGYCIIRMEDLHENAHDSSVGYFTSYAFSVTQWSMLALCMFFGTGHWCAFDGLHYGAAFIGFDEFQIIPQALLLTVDTFGSSHIVPVFGLPLLVASRYLHSQKEHRKRAFYMQLSQVYLIYGAITAVTTTLTMICVFIQRRHLMVWGLFAPKYVFDVVGLLLTDVLICVASLYYFPQSEDELQKQRS